MQIGDSQRGNGRAIGVINRPESERLSHYFRARLADQFDALAAFRSHTRARTTRANRWLGARRPAGRLARRSSRPGWPGAATRDRANVAYRGWPGLASYRHERSRAAADAGGNQAGDRPGRKPLVRGARYVGPGGSTGARLVPAVPRLGSRDWTRLSRLEMREPTRARTSRWWRSAMAAQLRRVPAGQSIRALVLANGLPPTLRVTPKCPRTTARLFVGGCLNAALRLHIAFFWRETPQS